MMVGYSENRQYRMVFSGFKNQIRKRIKLFDKFCKYHGTRAGVISHNLRIKVSRRNKCINTAEFFNKNTIFAVADLLNEKIYHISENHDSWRDPACDLYYKIKKDIEFDETDNEEELE